MEPGDAWSLSGNYTLPPTPCTSLHLPCTLPSQRYFNHACAPGERALRVDMGLIPLPVPRGTGARRGVRESTSLMMVRYAGSAARGGNGMNGELG